MMEMSGTVEKLWKLHGKERDFSGTPDQMNQMLIMAGLIGGKDET